MAPKAAGRGSVSREGVAGRGGMSVACLIDFRNSIASGAAQVGGFAFLAEPSASNDNHNMEMTDFVLECRHCANKAPMEILVAKSFVEHYEDDQNPRFPTEWDAGFIYQVLRCYSCRDVTVYQLAVHTGI